ncbi:hypothetical protein R6Q57_021373 [Mikania cordata]
MGWRFLYTLDQLNQHIGLEISVPEIALIYQLRTHGSSCFVLQRRSGAPIVVLASKFESIVVEEESRNEILNDLYFAGLGQICFLKGAI